ncbi:hypothetical protein SDRG_07579 [Saprolegnia diclina VS20]|uniref:Uncharacterized protein n=1 Tax=Saprolegnia diclina (strain VS20) TaxID=1156394 RepID=T0QJ72_SAPDV|nr:hypothetical protein SDRG_07579 [Saprolegnia diclina VS20]EQC34771.1 hypothetical protein SDRG_07579 [Saprolegnia diclina VS20]|eukprot:XP_008611643.1 hypothetical protein SDRG_07579 [Saprolegnia diclina VS20]
MSAAVHPLDAMPCLASCRSEEPAVAVTSQNKAHLPTFAEMVTSFKAEVATMQCDVRPSSPPATLDSIKQAFEDISFDRMRRHLTTSKKPFVVISGVSVEVFNAYFEDDEDAPVALRFVDLVNGSIIITDFPSEAHEAVIHKFVSEFLHASGDRDEVAPRGSFTASRGRGSKKKQADASFGPLFRTLNRGPPPTVDEGPPRVLRALKHWVTLAVEVGYSQKWNGLRVAGNWWSNYVGVKYVLLMRVDKNATKLQYRLYEITHVGDLPAPSRRGSMTLDNAAGAQHPILRIDTRVLLAIPPGEALPADMNDFCNVNLLRVLQKAHDVLCDD